MSNLKNLRAKDYDKYLDIILSPKQHQSTLAALFTFAHEISQIPVGSTENMIGLIKLQWWRDALEDTNSNHPIIKQINKTNINIPALQAVIDEYAKLLEDWQPHNFEELESFVKNTECVILDQAAKITGDAYNPDIALSYALTKFARQIHANAKHYKNFATSPELMMEKLIQTSRAKLPRSNNLFAGITEYYNRDLNRPKWKLLLKLLFTTLSSSGSPREARGSHEEDTRKSSPSFARGKLEDDV